MCSLSSLLRLVTRQWHAVRPRWIKVESLEMKFVCTVRHTVSYDSATDRKGCKVYATTLLSQTIVTGYTTGFERPVSLRLGVGPQILIKTSSLLLAYRPVPRSRSITVRYDTQKRVALIDTSFRLYMTMLLQDKRSVLLTDPHGPLSRRSGVSL